MLATAPLHRTPLRTRPIFVRLPDQRPIRDLPSPRRSTVRFRRFPAGRLQLSARSVGDCLPPILDAEPFVQPVELSIPAGPLRPGALELPKSVGVATHEIEVEVLMPKKKLHRPLGNIRGVEHEIDLDGANPELIAMPSTSKPTLDDSPRPLH